MQGRTSRLVPLLLASALALSGACGDDDDGAVEQADPTTTTTAAAEPDPTTTTVDGTTTTAAEPAGNVIEVEIVGGAPVGGVVDAEVALGEEVTIRVSADVADEVHVHGYDRVADVTPGTPAEITFTADIPGQFEIELEEAGLLIIELAVR